MPYIYSTASASCIFPVYIKKVQEGDKVARAAVETRRIEVKGGTGVAAKKTLIVPQGVVTRVTDEEFAELEKIPAFCRKVERGFYKVEKRNADVEKVVTDMPEKDRGAQATEEEFKTGKRRGRPRKAQG